MPRRIPTHRPACRPSPEAERRRYERQPARQADKDFYSAAAWRKLRAAFLAVNPLCAECERQGRVKAAEHVHHRVDRKQAPELAYDWDNLESLCASCHSKLASWGRRP